MDPLRYVDLQLEICHQLARNNDRYLSSLPNDSRYNGMRQAAAQIQQQDRETFEMASRNAKDALERERAYLGPGDDRRRQAVEDRFQQLEEFRRAFYGDG